MAWDMALEQRLRAKYTMPVAAPAGDGFVAEIAGKMLFAAPAATFSGVDELPAELAAAWAAQSKDNPYFKWVQGRFVEAEKANRNGALWSTSDLEFGQMSVKHGPLNWLHQSRKVIGSIADSALINPIGPAEQAAAALPLMRSTAGLTFTASSDTGTIPVLRGHQIEKGVQAGDPQQRPFIAVTASVWEWIWPDESAVVERASADGQLYLSMECVSESVECAGDGGCGKTFPYMQAATANACDHINSRSSVRRFINPSFLGGAVIVPPAQPGWGNANAVVMAQAAVLAEATADAAPEGLSSSEWEMFAAAVVASVVPSDI